MRRQTLFIARPPTWVLSVNPDFLLPEANRRCSLFIPSLTRKVKRNQGTFMEAISPGPQAQRNQGTYPEG